MKTKKQIVFLFFIFLFVFISIQNIHSQQEYKPDVLENFKLSLKYIMDGDYKNAITYSTRVIKADANSAVSYTIRARAYYELNDYDRAILDCNQAVKIDKNNATAYNIRGNAYEKKGDLKRALSDWQAAVRLNPNMEEAKRNIEIATNTNNNTQNN